jgi:hypothetical protein
MLISIGGKRWRLEYAALPNGDLGRCDAPDCPGKRIVLRPSLRRNPKLLLEVLIHEALHAAGWQLCEEAVTQIAADIARLLWSQGFRYSPQSTEVSHARD